MQVFDSSDGEFRTATTHVEIFGTVYERAVCICSTLCGECKRTGMPDV
jgi:hypothetical protein